jgi:purine-cytosine permease-like protein
MIVGAASVSASALAGITSDNPATAYVGVLPGWLAALTLIAIAIGAVAANVLNIYSGAMAFLSMGLPVHMRRARAYVAVVFGVVGFVIALLALGDAATGYENFLLVIVYWIGPWLGVMFADQWLRRDRVPAELLYDRSYTNPAGLIAMVVGIVVSVVLFSNQTVFTGLVARAVPEIGDITFLVGIVLSAGLYVLLARRRIRV